MYDNRATNIHVTHPAAASCPCSSSGSCAASGHLCDIGCRLAASATHSASCGSLAAAGNMAVTFAAISGTLPAISGTAKIQKKPPGPRGRGGCNNL